jgi:hypothetical protein
LRDKTISKIESLRDVDFRFRLATRDIANTPIAVNEFGACETEGAYFVTGGLSFGTPTNRAFVFNAPYNEWVETAPMPTARYRHFAFQLPNGYVFVCGGLDSLGNPEPTCLLYSAVTDSWTSAAPMTGRDGYPAALIVPPGEPKAGFVVVSGGVVAGSPSALVESYNPATNAWTTELPMSSARTGHGFVYLPVVGCVAISGYDGVGVAISSEALSPIFAAWSALGNVQTATYRSGYFVRGSSTRFAVKAGGFTDFAMSAATTRYEQLSVATWATPGVLALSAARAIPAVLNVVNEDQIIIAGGLNVGGTASGVTERIYFGAGDALAVATPLNTARYDAGAFRVGSLVGGVGPSGSLATIEVFDPTENVWRTFYTSLAGDEGARKLIVWITGDFNSTKQFTVTMADNVVRSPTDG